MRTTVTLEDDVVKELERLRRDQGLGMSAALNQLARQGMLARNRHSTDYVHASADLGIRLDVTNIAEVLDLLDEVDRPQ